MPHHRDSRRPEVRKTLPLLLLSLVFLVTCAAVAGPALGYEPWEHGGATESTCDASGCHRDQTPSNAACQRSGCHSSLTTAGGRLCWQCHKPGQAQSVACAGTCHLYRANGENPAYDVAFSHGDSPHLGASGYGKTCTDCHDSGIHHDAAEATAPACATCHDGGYAKSPPASHNDGDHVRCESCHDGMSLPSCAGCHVDNPTSGGPQITYTNSLTCDDAQCHGKIKNHVGTSISQAACTDCHTAHYASLGTCTKCHGDADTYHHAAKKAIPLNDCATCHDGGIAAAPVGHSIYGSDCTSCHKGMDIPSGQCLTCHDKAQGKVPAVKYTNDLSCGDVGCHGKIRNHQGTSIGKAACTTCHQEHYKSLGTCTTCHSDPVQYHHGTASATPLAQCETCHDGRIAAAKQSHAGFACGTCHDSMAPAPVPSTCQKCHEASTFGAQQCTACHSKSSGMFGDGDQVHSEDPSVACTTCHKPMYEDVGPCSTCHGSHAGVHHGTATPAATSLKATVSPRRIKKGSHVRLGGTLTGAAGPLAGQKVTLQRRTSARAAFKTVSTLTTGADGGFGRSLKPAKSTDYRLIWRAGGDLGSSQQPAVALLKVSVRRK